MKIYIASSWKNQHGVEMLTALLRGMGHEVVSWIENSYDEHLYEGAENLNKWIESANGSKAFYFDTSGAITCDLMILYTYAGNDAHAEMALAYTRNVPIIGLLQKGYEKGLMSKMVTSWCHRYTEVLVEVSAHAEKILERKKARSYDFNSRTNLETSHF